jgi:hypothetical protein
MKEQLNHFRAFIIDLTKVRKRLLAAVAVFVFLQLYFVRELIAAELLFGLGFAVLFFLATVFYVVGAVGERAIDVTKVGAHAVADSAHRGYIKASPILEVAAKRSSVFAEAGFKTLARSSHRGYGEAGVVVRRSIGATQMTARVITNWAIREWTRVRPELEAASKEIANFVESGAKALVSSSRRGFHKIEEISKKPFRHPRSESAR